ncbi:hypothetical protein BSLG_003232 [Batrachochytrium salamandrivorans]|nr:hypothetical protein BSLG_003232 [Batrachochytrium salamandrivorans]
MDGKKVVSISGGVFHTAALVQVNGQGQVHVWGSNFFGQAGYFPELQSAFFSSDEEEVVWEPRWLQENLQDENILQLSCGDFHSVVLTQSGKVLTWGAGLLGHSNEYFESRPHVIEKFRELSDPMHIRHVAARMGLTLATASPTPNTPATRVFIWGHYDACAEPLLPDGSSTQRVKSTVPVEIPIAGLLDSVSLVDASHHLVVIQGVKDGQIIYLVYGSHPSSRLLDQEPTDIPYYAILEKVAVVNEGYAPLKLIATLSDSEADTSVPRRIFIASNTIVVLRESGKVQIIPMFNKDSDHPEFPGFGEPIIDMAASPLSILALGKSGAVYHAAAFFPPKPKRKSFLLRLIDRALPEERRAAAELSSRSEVSLVDALRAMPSAPIGIFPEARLIGTGWKHHFIVS